MTKEEFEKEIKSLQDRYVKDCISLASEYAETNNPYKIGDIIEDHVGVIKIESWKLDWHLGSSSVPRFKYFGVQMTKKLEVAKRQFKTDMYQRNIKRKLNKD